MTLQERVAWHWGKDIVCRQLDCGTHVEMRGSISPRWPRRQAARDAPAGLSWPSAASGNCPGGPICAWMKRCPNPMPAPSEIEIRPLYEIVDLRRDCDVGGRGNPVRCGFQRPSRMGCCDRLHMWRKQTMTIIPCAWWVAKRKATSALARRCVGLTEERSCPSAQLQ